MKMDLSPQDWQQLSDFLDQQLDPKLIQSVNEKLRQSPEWMEAYEELRLNRKLIRLLPRRRAPRNFTIKAGSIPAASHKSPPFVPLFSFVSGLCALLLVLSLVFQNYFLPASVFPKVQNGGSSSITPPANASTLLKATPQLFSWNNQTGDLSGSSQVFKINPEAPDIDSLESTPNPSLAFQKTPYGQPIQGSGPILGIQPTQNQGKVITAFPALPPGSQTAPSAPISDLNWYRIILLGLAILSAAAALVFWIINRH